MIQSLLKPSQLINSYSFVPKPQQQQALEQLREFLKSTESFFLLCGYAGTGKTTIIIQFINSHLAPVRINPE